jgi:hypothetical protein
MPAANTIRRALTLSLIGMIGLILLGSTGCNSIAPAGTWAIRCITRVGPEQYTEAQNLADSLRRVEQLDPQQVRVYTDTDGGHVYYGSFRRSFNPRTNTETFEPDPSSTLSLIRSLSYDGGQSFPFAGAILEEIPSGETGPGKWDLSEVDGYWTLQIAVFYNTAEMNRRRQAAVDFCRELRTRGYEAYYYHSMSKSVVTLGAYPEWAVQFKEETPISLTGKPAQKRTVVKINNPGLIKLQEEFPYNYENGARIFEKKLNARTGKIEKVARPSFMAKLPKVTRREQELDVYQSVLSP